MAPETEQAPWGFRGFALRLGLAGMGGAMLFLAFPNWDLFPLAWIGLVPLLWAARGATGRRQLLLGLFAGTVANTGCFYWIAGMLQDFGHMSVPVSLAISSLMWVYQGLCFGVFLWLFGVLERRVRIGAWLIAPVVLVASEYLWWLIFPWYLGNSQYKVPALIQIAELGGVLAITFLLGMTNGALYDALQALRQGARRRALAFAGLALFVPGLDAAYGLVRVGMVEADARAARKLKIGLVEADVGIWEKEDPQKTEDNLVRHQRLSIELERAGAELIVWPETAYHAPFTVARTPERQDPGRFQPIPHDVTWIAQSDVPPKEHAREDVLAGTPVADRVAPQRGFKTPLLFGALTYRRNSENKSARHPGIDFLNSAILLDREGNSLGIYHKVYLLLFGEHVPLSETFPIFYRLLPEAGDLTPGDAVSVLPFDGARIGVMICYEDILPAFIRKVAREQPNVLINITNDAWFGKTAEPALHMAVSVFRTVESRLSMVRSTNTGISCFVDPAGRIRKQTSIEGAETLLDEVPLMEGGTPYQLLGDWPAWLSLCAIAWWLWRAAARGRSRAGSNRGAESAANSSAR